ncbi:MAG: phospholipid carrier-dependent glycosyltransferase, partial [Cyanobacteria bacterium P01_H01_bin.121]
MGFKRTQVKPWLSPLCVFLLALGLRFWGLNRLSQPVFDEVYFSQFANNYLTGTPFYDTHPPLGKYLIAIGIWLYQFLNPDAVIQTVFDSSTAATFGHRWLNALVGSCIPLLVMAIAQVLTGSASYTFLAGIFTALDGVFIVESRYGLLNVYLVAFGLLCQVCFLHA